MFVYKKTSTIRIIKIIFREERVPIFTVLLVDDEPLVLEGLSFMVDWEKYGFRVCGEACDGEEALGRIKELNPDLVVTDISMPIMDGLHLIEHCAKVLKASSRFVILSGHDDFPSAQKALTNGVLDYWLKPINTEEIYATLEKLHREWSRAAVDDTAGLPSKASALETVWSVPDADDSLFDAEDRLLLAIQTGNEAAVVDAASSLCRQLELSFGSNEEAGRAFLSNVLLELTWKVHEGETADSSLEGEEEFAPQVLPCRADRWPSVLAAFALKASGRLARQRSVTGPAGEAARFIRERYSEPLQLQTIARMLHFQPAYLGELFKKQMGMPFLDYVHRTRVEAARKLLRRTDLKIADISRSVGYDDPEQFTAKFKHWMGMTPSQYKNG
ncbi:helix-turn-helix domain-containing protein [Paenibacillus sp. NEAU-GSW1]|uniref:response regulator transcription factor n=1 Tax=Paenibacillus sp. NEAU-GSW1 TaxID=2682486 RepID=UPI0012E163B4|nr:helix-turn-helix domain-containing protein [Paenibacillus sp. NEAU-GSW1]MUT64699.1 response regulator [Paenibacillus sp. NEAU-GSW1]